MADQMHQQAALAFLEEFADSQDWRAALVAAIVQQMVTIGAGFIGKRAARGLEMPSIDLGKMMSAAKPGFEFAEGGQIGTGNASWSMGSVEGFGWNPFRDIRDRIRDWLRNPLRPPRIPGLPGIPGIPGLPGTGTPPEDCLKLLDPEFLYKEFFLDMSRATLEGALKDLLTPGEYDDPHNMAHWVDIFHEHLNKALEMLADCGIMPNLTLPSPGNMVLPFMGNGGRLTSGQPAIVGERGPELWIPDQPGTVIPNPETELLLDDRHPSQAKPIVVKEVHHHEQPLTIPITVVTPEGKTLMKKTVTATVDELKRRTGSGEILIDTRGVGDVI